MVNIKKTVGIKCQQWCGAAEAVTTARGGARGQLCNTALSFLKKDKPKRPSETHKMAHVCTHTHIHTFTQLEL